MLIETLDRTSLTVSDEEFETNVEAAVSAIAEQNRESETFQEKPSTQPATSQPQAGPSRKEAPQSSDDDAAAPAKGLIETLAQGRRGVDVVLALYDDDDDVLDALVQHDGISVHTAVHDTHLPGRLTSLTRYW